MNASVRTARSGFTLLELVIVVSILAILAGVAVPVAERAIERAARRATEDELAVLAGGAEAFFEDCGRLPRGAAELRERPADVAAWAGPYLVRTADEDRSGAELDAFGRPIRFDVLDASRLRLASDGARAGDRSDDLALELDVTPLRRARTRETLELVNAALRRRNAREARPLAPPWEAVLTELVGGGWLPEAEAYRRDAWGEALVCDPPDAGPVVRVTSRRLAR